MEMDKIPHAVFVYIFQFFLILFAPFRKVYYVGYAETLQFPRC